MNASRFFVALAMVLGLSACAQSGVSVVTNEESSIFTLDEYYHDASRGDILVVVRGGLPGISQQMLENYVVAHMQGADWPPHAHFTATPSPNIAKMFSYVMMINGPNDVTASALCANPGKPQPAVTPAKPGDLVLVAGLCRYTQAMMGVTARVSGVNDLNDIKFHQLIVAAVQELTTPRRTSPFDQHDGGDHFFGIH